MRVIETAKETRAARAGLAQPVALVPALGALHAGHEALLGRARADAESLVASLFVNPTQFGPDEDYERYPVDREADLEILERHGVDLVFAPSLDEMYPEGESTRVDPGPIARVLEGERRPGHFIGVATVVAKLFSIVRPDLAYFGEKDAQQLIIIRRLARDLRFGTRIVAVPTAREADGLAFSSRNRYLWAYDRRAAATLYRALCEARRLWRSGVRDAAALRSSVKKTLSSEPRVHLEYVSVVDPETLDELERAEGSALLSLAAQVGPARLIDNVALQEQEPHPGS